MREIVKSYWFVILLLLVTLLCSLLEPAASELLAYNRAASEQWWRFFTANLVHLGSYHWLLNVIGLGLIVWIFRSALSGSQWIITLSLLMIANIIALHFFVPRVHHYVGMSGALHGALVMVLLLEWRRGQRIEFVPLEIAALSNQLVESINSAIQWLGRYNYEITLLIIIIKVVSEQFAEDAFVYQPALGGAVVPEAHLIGVIQGLILGCLWPVSRKTNGN